MERAGKRVPLMLSFAMVTICCEGGVTPEVWPNETGPHIVTPARARVTKRMQSSRLQRKKLERETRIELATNSLEGCDSTIELLPLIFLFYTGYPSDLRAGEPAVGPRLSSPLLVAP